MKLNENYIAAVEDANGKKYVKKIGLMKTSKFFNSGVMLLILKNGEKNDIFAKAIKISMENTGTKWAMTKQF